MPTSVTTALQEAPLPELVKNLGVAISQAHFAMDRTPSRSPGSSRTAKAGHRSRPGSRSLLELGFTPTFFQVTEAVIEARVAFSSSDTDRVRRRRLDRRQRVLRRRLGERALLESLLVRRERVELDPRHLRRLPPPSIFNELLRSIPSRTQLTRGIYGHWTGPSERPDGGHDPADGFAIADAQVQLDESSLRVAEMMSGERVERNANGLPTGDTADTRVSFDGERSA